MYGLVKRAGKTVFIHSGGRVQELFPDLIESGLDVFNPFQPQVMDPYVDNMPYDLILSTAAGVSTDKIELGQYTRDDALGIAKAILFETPRTALGMVPHEDS